MMNWAKQQLANVAGTQEPIYGPDAIQSVAKQAESTPYSELKKEDLNWTAMESTCVETQSFYLMADSGHMALVQVLYSNVAGIRTTSQFNTKIFYPDNKTPHIWSSNQLENYGFDDQMLSFYADNFAVTLSDDGSSYTIKSATNDNSIVNLKVTRTAPGFQVGKDGKSFYGTDPSHPWGAMRHAFWPRNDVTGTIVTKSGELDFKGNAFMSFALQGMKPHHAAARWNFADFQSPSYSAVMMEFITPPSYGSTVVNVGGLVRNGEIVCAGSSNSATQTEVKSDPETDWSEPRAVKFHWSGTTKDGKPVSAHLEGPLKQRLDRVDVMAEVPQFVKSIVGGLVGTKPYIYQYAQPITLRIKIGEEELEEQGTVFYEATFIS